MKENHFITISNTTGDKNEVNFNKTYKILKDNTLHIIEQENLFTSPQTKLR